MDNPPLPARETHNEPEINQLAWLDLIVSASDPHQADPGPWGRPNLSLLIEAIDAISSPDGVCAVLNACSVRLGQLTDSVAAVRASVTGAWRVIPEITSRLRQHRAWTHSISERSKQTLIALCLVALDQFASTPTPGNTASILTIPNDYIQPIAFIHLALVDLEAALPLSYFSVESGFCASSPPLALDVLARRNKSPAFAAHLFAYNLMGWIAPDDARIRLAQWAQFIEYASDRVEAITVLVTAIELLRVGPREQAFASVQLGGQHDGDIWRSTLETIYTHSEIAEALCRSHPVYPNGLVINSFIARAGNDAENLIAAILNSIDGGIQDTSAAVLVENAKKALVERSIRDATRALPEDERVCPLVVGGPSSNWASSRMEP